GAAGFYRKFIPRFSIIVSPLNKLTRNRKQKFYWHQEQQEAFEQLKKVLSTEPLLLSFPDSTSPLVLSTDASDIGYGGVLKQVTKAGPQPICYLSRRLKPAEKRYNPIYWAGNLRWKLTIVLYVIFTANHRKMDE
ncbi:unnamed protein product, partial [Didymodactylos carnosus]